MKDTIAEGLMPSVALSKVRSAHAVVLCGHIGRWRWSKCSGTK